jgi:hypothetical protein
MHPAWYGAFVPEISARQLPPDDPANDGGQYEIAQTRNGINRAGENFSHGRVGSGRGDKVAFPED